MDMIGRIRRLHSRKHKSEREISRMLAVVSPRTNLAVRPRFDGWHRGVLLGAVGAVSGGMTGAMPSIRTAHRRRRCRLRRVSPTGT